MSAPPSPPCPRYIAPDESRGGRPCALVWRSGTPAERRFAFCDQVQIGRDDEGCALVPGVLLVADPAISRRHCIVRQSPDGRCFVRDVSRNGTRLDGRRMVPNLEVEIRPGQTLTIGPGIEFMLEGIRVASIAPEVVSAGRTLGVSDQTIATVLVGDIRDYTTLVRRAPSLELQQSVNRVFEIDHGEMRIYEGNYGYYLHKAHGENH